MDRMDELARMADAHFRGPAFNAWPAGRGGKLRPGSGGGGGDGGAAKQEAARQKRIDSAIAAINNIFAGNDTVVPGDRATSYDPSRTYYTSEGTQWVAPTMATQIDATQVFDPATGRSVQKAPNTFGGGGDGDTNYYRPVGDLSLGHWDDRGGDYGKQWVWNPDVTPPDSGEYGGAPTYTRTVLVPDTKAINDALQSGDLYTNMQTIKGVNRKALYDEQRQAVTDLNSRDVNRQFQDAERANRFGLARAGLTGGSADVDSNAELSRRTNEGLIKAAGIGDQAAADLQTADERTRQNLISMAQSGIDTGQAQQLALQQLDANSASAASARSGATVGNLFDNLASAYLLNQQIAGQRAGTSPYTGYFQPGVTTGSTRTGYAGS